MKKRLGALAALFLAGFVVGCSKAPQTPEALMKRGTDALYVQNDAKSAAGEFRRVLALNPEHYGATYQLAVALDRMGKQDEATPHWEKVLRMAETYKDVSTADAARKRLPKAESPAEDPTMKAGLDALYARSDYPAAVVAFQSVLAATPDHYGATYQLATALDRQGKRGEARPLWERVLQMAEGYRDQKTVDTARKRLAEQP